MIDASDDAGTLTLAFSLSAIERLDDPNAVFEDAETWSQIVGIVDSDTDRIQSVVAEFELRQDFDVAGRDKWFLLEEICENAQTPRHVYIGDSDDDMRVATLFCWEYIRITEAAEKAGWELTERENSGITGRLVSAIRALIG